jgi:hypothetical protein
MPSPQLGMRALPSGSGQGWAGVRVAVGSPSGERGRANKPQRFDQLLFRGAREFLDRDLTLESGRPATAWLGVDQCHGPPRFCIAGAALAGVVLRYPRGHIKCDAAVERRICALHHVDRVCWCRGY